MSIADAVITDAHQHFWTKDVIAGLFEKLGVPLDSVEVIVRDFEPADLKPWLDKLGISQTVVVQVNSTLENTRYFLERADRIRLDRRRRRLGGPGGPSHRGDAGPAPAPEARRLPPPVARRGRPGLERAPGRAARPEGARQARLALRPAGQAARMEIHPSGGRGGSGPATWSSITSPNRTSQPGSSTTGRRRCRWPPASRACISSYRGWSPRRIRPTGSRAI